MIAPGHPSRAPGDGAGIEQVVHGVPRPTDHVRQREPGLLESRDASVTALTDFFEATTLEGSMVAKLTSGWISATVTRCSERT